MKIVIVGCGKVGFTLAETLSSEGHDISVIDVNGDALSRLSSLDVSTVKGNGSSYRVLQDANVQDSDILIAVTNKDEINLLCCLIAKKAGTCRTIARVRNPEYYEEINFIKDELGLSLGIKSKPIKNVMIIGGGTVAFYLARRLGQAHIHVTIIEMQRARCEELSEKLPHANIVLGNAFNGQLLLDEGLASADAVVTLTNFDEENIMLSLYANRMSRAKLITKVNMNNFNCVIDDIPIGSVISPKHLTAETILHYARALRNSADSDVEAVHMLADNRVEALAFRIKEHSSVTDRTLMQMRIRKGVLIGAIIRDNAVIIPSGQDCLLPGDLVIVVTTLKGIDSIKGILE